MSNVMRCCSQHIWCVWKTPNRKSGHKWWRLTGKAITFITWRSVQDLYSSMHNVIDIIKTHGSMSCGPRKPWACDRQVCFFYFIIFFTELKKMPFSYICSSTLPEQKHTNFTNSLGVGYLQFRIWAEFAKLFPRYAPSYFLCIFLLFALLFEITITHACFN